MKREEKTKTEEINSNHIMQSLVPVPKLLRVSTLTLFYTFKSLPPSPLWVTGAKYLGLDTFYTAILTSYAEPYYQTFFALPFCHSNSMPQTRIFSTVPTCSSFQYLPFLIH